MDEERLTVDAYVVHFLTKSVHTILTARIPDLKATHETAVDRWFNFPVKEVDGAKNILREWKGMPHTPLVIKILYRSLDEDDDSRIALEVWKLEYDNIPARPLHASLSYQDDACALYKNLIVLVRVLYAFLRTLPTHHLFRSATMAQGRQFTLEFELEVGGENATSLGASSQWKEVLATDTSGGRVSIQVITHDIKDLLQRLDRLRSVPSSVSDDWISFVRKSEVETPQEVFNPVMAHLKVSFESMRSAMTTLMNQKRSFKKTLSFPQSRRASQKADESSDEEHIYVFLSQLQATRWPEDADNVISLSVSEGRTLLSLYKQRRSLNDPHP